MIKCIIIDDEQHAIDLLNIHIQKIDNLTVLKTFNNPLNAISFLEQNLVELIFLDIEMPEISGIQFIKIIRKKRIPIILTSAYKEYALEGFENEVLDYILKPISFERLLQSVQRLRTGITQLSANQNDFIVVKTDSKRRLLKIDLADILYIEGLKNYISVFTSQQRIISLLNLKSFEENLPKDTFIRTHKSFIISVNKVRLIDGNQIFLKGVEQSIPISDSYRKNLFQLFRQNLIENK